jgi:hypothetical protein
MTSSRPMMLSISFFCHLLLIVRSFPHGIFLRFLIVQCMYNLWSCSLCNYLKGLESHSPLKCCHKHFVYRNLIYSRHIYVIRSNNAVLFTLQVGKTQSLAIFAITPKTHTFTHCESCCRLWGNVRGMCGRIRERERLIAAARTSGRGVAYCLRTLL